MIWNTLCVDTWTDGRGIFIKPGLHQIVGKIMKDN